MRDGVPERVRSFEECLGRNRKQFLRALRSVRVEDGRAAAAGVGLQPFQFLLQHLLQRAGRAGFGSNGTPAVIPSSASS